MLHADELFTPVLAALSAEGSTAFGAPGARVEVLRRIDGPFSSVRHVSIRTPTSTTAAYLKILKPRRPGQAEAEMIDRMLKREYLATRALYDALRQDSRIGAVEPIAWFPEHRAIVTTEVPGRPLAVLLAESAAPDELAAVLESAGRWIRVYQSLGEDRGDRVSFAERRQYLDDRLKRLTGRVLTEAERQAVLARVDRLVSEIGGDSVPAVPMHADLNPLNIIVDDTGRMTVLDFTMAKPGCAYHDLSHLYFHLALFGARHRAKRDAVDRLQRALLAGYSPGLSAGEPLFRLMLLVHGVCHLALMAERRLPVVDMVYQWYMRRRWRLCLGLVDAQEAGAAAGARTEPAVTPVPALE